MTRRISIIAALGILWSAQCFAQNAYITDAGSNTVSVIDTKSDKVIATIPVGNLPFGVAVTPNGNKVYVANNDSATVSVIDTTTNTVTSTIPTGNSIGVAVNADGSRVYVTNLNEETISVIDTATDTVISTIPVTVFPYDIVVANQKIYFTNCNVRCFFNSAGIVTVIDTVTNKVINTIPTTFDVVFPVLTASPDGSRVYVSNETSENVLVIDTSMDNIIAAIPVEHPISSAVSPDGTKIYVPNFGNNVAVVDAATNTVIATTPVINGGLSGISVTPDGRKIFVANSNANTVTVVDTATDKIAAVIPAGVQPVALGSFIQPALKFHGIPGQSNCFGQSTSALAKTYGGSNAAAAALGFSSVKDLQNAIQVFCGG